MWDWIIKAAKDTAKFFDGKKTVIGFSLVTISKVIPDPLISTILLVSGTLLGGVGVVDKVKKGELKKRT